MNIDWWTFGASLLASGGVSWGSATWLGQKWIEHRLERALVEQKVQLKAQADAELERIRTQHSILIAERNIVFSKLHEKRFLVIEKTYSKLNTLDINTRLYLLSITKPSDAPVKTTHDKIQKELDEFYAYWLKIDIFLPDTTNKIISKMMHDIYETSRGFNESCCADTRQKELRDQSFSDFLKCSTDAIHELRNEFRKTLQIPGQ